MKLRYNRPEEGVNIIKRQGDILFIKLDKLPKGLKEQESKILVYGEATGHAHRLQEGSVFTNKDGLLYLVLSKASKIVHEEHKPIKLEKGLWGVVRQREYHPEEIRTVID